MILSWPLFRQLFLSRNSLSLLLLTIMGLGLSLAVVLGSLGIMRGFDVQLRSSLRKFQGDAQLTHYGQREISLSSLSIVKNSPFYEKGLALYKEEAFAMNGEKATGVRAFTLDFEKAASFYKGLQLTETKGMEGVILGRALARKLSLDVGESIALATLGAKGRPKVSRHIVGHIAELGPYEQDSRSVFIPARGPLKINTLYFTVKNGKNLDQEVLKRILSALSFELPQNLLLRPYWVSSFGLLEAVKAEKWLMALILQILVLMSLLNLFGVLYWLSLKQRRPLCLAMALGLSKKSLKATWPLLLLGLWLGGLLFSFPLLMFFDWSLQNLSFLQLPPDIYQLGKLSLIVSGEDIAIAAGLSFIFIALMGPWHLRKITKMASLSLALRTPEELPWEE